MSGRVAIKVEGLSKSYVLHHQQREAYQSLRDVVAKKASRLLSGSNGSKDGFQNTETFWALKDVSFEINKGERVGIIGRNGAGKSTLLKLLSRITEPTKGKISIKGRVASLLEVGTGFHPELTGRENVFLNGSILGMSKDEIKSKFDEIVAFAEVEKFLDTPVKRYSSGMYVRLAFAVAAHLEPEILIVDEVLAVGDAEFQKKCLGKMKDVAGEGRTVIFVSHNMAAIQNLCSTSILLDKGRNIMVDQSKEVINYYQNNLNNDKNITNILLREDRKGSGIVKITNLSYSIGDSLEFKLSFESTQLDRFKGRVYIAIYDQLNNCIIFLDSSVIPNVGEYFPNSGTFHIKLSKDLMLIAGTYKVNVAILVNDEWVDHIENALTINVEDTDFYKTGKLLYFKPMLHVSQAWKLNSVD